MNDISPHNHGDTEREATGSETQTSTSYRYLRTNDIIDPKGDRVESTVLGTTAADCARADVIEKPREADAAAVFDGA